jgi:hypothetical protein
MVFSAKVKDGVIVLDGDRHLPEGTTVTVAVPDFIGQRFEKEGPTLLERLSNVVGKAKGGPPDGSVNVDHYLYGLSRR